MLSKPPCSDDGKRHACCATSPEQPSALTKTKLDKRPCSDDGNLFVQSKRHACCATSPDQPSALTKAKLDKRPCSDDGNLFIQSRRHACCLDQPSALTKANLDKLQSSLEMKSPRRIRSPEKEKPEKLDTKDKLQLFNVFFEETADFPSPLQRLISDLKQNRVGSSPNAELIAQKEPLVRGRGEQDAIDLIRDALLIRPAVDKGEKLIGRSAKPNFNRHFLPHASSAFVAAQGIRLETPQPDLCFGYLPSKRAKPGRVKATFTADEEDTINHFSLTPELYFPFFTVQWKSSAKGQTHDQALPQGARDGATIVSYLHEFYTKARPHEPPDATETCHFSITIDSRSYILWVHWREEEEDGNVKYHMEDIELGMLKREEDNARLWTIMRNLVHLVQQPRLATIKRLLPSLKTALLEGYKLKPREATSGPSSFASSGTPSLFQPPALVQLSDSIASSSQLSDFSDRNQQLWATVTPSSLPYRPPGTPPRQCRRSARQTKTRRTLPDSVTSKRKQGIGGRCR